RDPKRDWSSDVCSSDLIAGEENPTKGEISKPKDYKIGYLPQDMIHQHGRTVFEETASAFQEINILQQRLEEVNKEFETRTDYEKIGRASCRERMKMTMI